jgi:hypothetical protein
VLVQAVSAKEKSIADSRNMVQTLVMGMKSLLYSLSSFGNTHQVHLPAACLCLSCVAADCKVTVM